MKTDSKLTIVSVILVILVCFFLWKDEIFKPKENIVTPYYENRIIIIEKKTGDTVFNKRIRSLNSMEYDSLKIYLNKI